MHGASTDMINRGTVSGRPEAFCYSPESFGGTSDLLKYVANRDYQYASEHIVETEDENVYSEYFRYVMTEVNIAYPNTCEEALKKVLVKILYWKKLMEVLLKFY